MCFYKYQKENDNTALTILGIFKSDRGYFIQLAECFYSVFDGWEIKKRGIDENKFNFHSLFHLFPLILFSSLHYTK